MGEPGLFLEADTITYVYCKGRKKCLNMQEHKGSGSKDSGTLNYSQILFYP